MDLKEKEDVSSADDTVKSLMDDLKTLLENEREILALAGDNDDDGTGRKEIKSTLLIDDKNRSDPPVKYVSIDRDYITILSANNTIFDFNKIIHLKTGSGFTDKNKYYENSFCS
ncbi:MAG: hypothetical protein WD577_10465 [Bacteroidales bacterium]